MSTLLFPTLPGLAWGLTRTPVWASRVQKSVSGKRQAVGYMSFPNYRWTLSFNILRSVSSNNELATLQGFFNQLKGQVDTFRFVDPNDATATTDNFGTGDGTTKDFQLQRTYGGFKEPVQNVNTITSLTKAGVAQTNPTNYTVGSTGIVSFVTAPAVGNALAWTGTFYWRCAFTQDTLDLINQDGVDIWKTNKLSFESIKL